MQVKLLRRWGQHDAGDTVKVDNTQGRWLVAHALGTATGVQAPMQEAAAPGSDGSDPVISGDATRLGTPAFQKSPRRDNGALPVEGSPVQYNNGIAPHAAEQGADGQPTEPGPKAGSAGRRRGKAPSGA
jgi:hypothetical protein